MIGEADVFPQVPYWMNGDAAEHLNSKELQLEMSLRGQRDLLVFLLEQLPCLFLLWLGLSSAVLLFV